MFIIKEKKLIAKKGKNTKNSNSRVFLFITGQKITSQNFSR